MVQMAYLEEWAVMDRDYSSSLTEAIEALKASTFRLPVVDGARVRTLSNINLFPFYNCIKEYFSLNVAILAIDDSSCFLYSFGFSDFMSKQADVQHVKDAISSVVDVMHAMASYICFLLPKVNILW